MRLEGLEANQLRDWCCIIFSYHCYHLSPKCNRFIASQLPSLRAIPILQEILLISKNYLNFFCL
jgi:hypothetical protein